MDGLRMTDTAMIECSACGAGRRFEELIEVVNVRSGELRHVCRPGVSRECFRSTRSADLERIRATAPRRPAA